MCVQPERREREADARRGPRGGRRAAWILLFLQGVSQQRGMSCASLVRALGEETAIQHWSVGGADDNARALALLRASSAGLHVSVFQRRKHEADYFGATLDDAGLARLRDALPFVYDDDDESDEATFEDDLAAALRTRPAFSADRDGGPRLTLYFDSEGDRRVAHAIPLNPDTGPVSSDLFDDLIHHFEPREAPADVGDDDGPPEAAASVRGFQPQRRGVAKGAKRQRR